MTENELGEKIVCYRAKYNLSQTEMAKLCKLTLQTIWNIENGVQTPTRLTKQKILNVISKGKENEIIGKFDKNI